MSAKRRGALSVVRHDLIRQLISIVGARREFRAELTSQALDDLCKSVGGLAPWGPIARWTAPILAVVVAQAFLYDIALTNEYH